MSRTKAMIALAVLVGIAIVISVTNRVIESAGFDFVGDDYVRLYYQPLQCEKTPWWEWYDIGEINFYSYPTDRELIISYYSQKHSIEVSGADKVVVDRDFCEACTCHTPYYFWIEVYEPDAEKMLELGWQKKI